MARKKKLEPGPAGNVDYIPHGSDEHAHLIGLRKAEEGEELVVDGRTLADRTAWGPQATESYIKEVLRQKVAEVKAGKPPKTQSEDPLEPNYAPPMWKPSEEPTRGMV